MAAIAAVVGGWALQESTPADVDRLMDWFPRARDVEIWGGPSFRFPFTRRSFRKDLHWGRMRSFSLRDPGADFVAFGQIYKRSGRVHLARLVVRPDQRGRGIGKRLIGRLMAAGREIYRRDEYSLFVFRENVPAFECYRSMGFEVSDYPDDMPHADVCWFLTRSDSKEEN